MTPKEKAIELYNTFRDTMTVTTANYRSKKQALICVDEILNELDKLSSGDGYFESRFDFYSDVKIELQNI